MQRCCACPRVADMVFIHNTKLGLCLDCREHFVGIPMQSAWAESEGIKAHRAALKKHAQQFGRRVCECGDTIYHGGLYCPTCRDDAIRILFRICGAEALANNPVTWHLTESAIRFKQWLHIANERELQRYYIWIGEEEGNQYIPVDRFVHEVENSA